MIFFHPCFKVIQNRYLIASYCSHCTSSSKEIEKPDFKSGLKLINISFLIGSSLCCHLHKLCLVKKDTKLNQVYFLIKSSEIILIFLPRFYLIISLMTSPKNFVKLPILKTWNLVFFGGIKTYFGIIPLKWCFFKHEEINVWTKICHSFWPN